MGGVVSGGAALLGMMNGGSSGTASGSGANQAYIGNDRAGMDANFQNNYSNYSNAMNQSQNMTNPMARQTLQGQYNNPQSGQYMQGANNAAYMYGQQAQQAGAAGKQEYGAGNQLYQQAFDPQQALYNQQLGQLNDATNASEYSRGIQNSPAGASVTANADANFQNQWQNQQLGREAQGVQAMNGADQGAMGLGQNAAQMYSLQGSTPYNAQNQIYSNQSGAINNYQASQQPYMQQQNQLQSNALGYLNNAQGAQNQAFGQNQTLQNNMNTALGQLSGPMQSAWSNWNSPSGQSQSQWSNSNTGNTSANNYLGNNTTFDQSGSDSV